MKLYNFIYLLGFLLVQYAHAGYEDLEIPPEFEGLTLIQEEGEKLSFQELKRLGFSFDERRYRFRQPKENVFYYKKRSRSLIKWKDIDPYRWLDVQEWIRERQYRDSTPFWEQELRNRNNVELMGRVLGCVGECRIYRGNTFVYASYRSTINEGDDVVTGKSGYIIIYLMDGTLVRLSPQTSMTFKEINFGIEENFLHVRLNEGNAFWLSRQSYKFSETNKAETDVLFLPLRLQEANASTEKKSFFEDDLSAFLSPDTYTLRQYQRLNRLVEENNKFTGKRPTYSFIVMPNGTLYGKNLVMDIYYALNKEAYFYLRDEKNIMATFPEDPPEQEEPLSFKHDMLNEVGDEDNGDPVLHFMFRGYNNREKKQIEVSKWYKVDSKGREVEEVEKIPLAFKLNQIITRRFPTILVAREIMLKRYTEPIYKRLEDRWLLARDAGYQLWGKIYRNYEGRSASDLEQRVDFLTEYTRRIETTALVALSKVYLTLNEETKANLDPDKRFYSQRAFAAYLSRINEVKLKKINATNERYWLLKEF